MLKTIAILVLDRGGSYEEVIKLCEKINASIIIISNNSSSRVLKWAAEKRLKSLSVLFSHYVPVSEGKHKKQMCLTTHARTEEIILSFLLENNAECLLINTKSIRLTDNFLKKYGKNKVFSLSDLNDKSNESLSRLIDNKK